MSDDSNTGASRPLTDKELEILERRRANFEGFFFELMPVLVEFAEDLELPNPHMILTEADHYVEPIDAWVRKQHISPEDRAWLHARLAYLIGEVLVQGLHGHWFLNEVPDSRFFLLYVVGNFTRLRNSRAQVDPFLVAHDYLAALPATMLQDMLSAVRRELEQC